MASLLDEHFGYITQPGRTDSYVKAIAAVVRPGDVVADLGCGFGVLGMACLEAGAARIYGIDHSDALAIARETARRAGMAERYLCIAESTFRTELPERVDLLICDHVGYFGFDYGIVAMLADARRRMLKPSGLVMPALLSLRLAGVSSGECRALADGWALAPVPPEYHWLREYGLNSKHRVLIDPQQLCSDEAVLGEIDLQTDVADSLAFECNLTATRDCRFDGLAGWFECRLGGDVWMTNSPSAPDSIERNQVFLSCSEPFPVRAGEEIRVSLRIRHDDATIAWTIAPPHGGPRQKLTTWKSRILVSADLIAPTGRPLRLSRSGDARKLVLALVDGNRSAAEIEDAAVQDHPELLPSEAEIRRFVRQVIGENAE